MKYFNCLIILLLLFFFSKCNGYSSIYGHVYDYDTGKPLKGASVSLYNKADALIKDSVENKDITDDNGHYKLDLKEENSMNYIEVRKNGYIPYCDGFNIQKDNEIVIYLKETSKG